MPSTSLLEDQRQIYEDEEGPPLLPHGDDPDAIRPLPRQKRTRSLPSVSSSSRQATTTTAPPPSQATLPPPPPVNATDKISLNCDGSNSSSTNSTVLSCGVGHELPHDFVAENDEESILLVRAMAAYSLLRTLSIPLRLSPFFPQAFLRALSLPVPSRLLGDIHVAVLRVLLQRSNSSYHWGGSMGSLYHSHKRSRDGLRYPLRGSDHLELLDRYTWPVFLDDYCHLTADVLYASIHDTTRFAVDMRLHNNNSNSVVNVSNGNNAASSATGRVGEVGMGGGEDNDTASSSSSIEEAAAAAASSTRSGRGGRAASSSLLANGYSMEEEEDDDEEAAIVDEDEFLVDEAAIEDDEDFEIVKKSSKRKRNSSTGNSSKGPTGRPRGRPRKKSKLEQEKELEEACRQQRNAHFQRKQQLFAAQMFQLQQMQYMQMQQQQMHLQREQQTLGNKLPTGGQTASAFPPLQAFEPGGGVVIPRRPLLPQQQRPLVTMAECSSEQQQLLQQHQRAMLRLQLQQWSPPKQQQQKQQSLSTDRPPLQQSPPLSTSSLVISPLLSSSSAAATTAAPATTSNQLLSNPPLPSSDLQSSAVAQRPPVPSSLHPPPGITQSPPLPAPPVVGSCNSVNSGTVHNQEAASVEKMSSGGQHGSCGGIGSSTTISSTTTMTNNQQISGSPASALRLPPGSRILEIEEPLSSAAVDVRLGQPPPAASSPLAVAAAVRSMMDGADGGGGGGHGSSSSKTKRSQDVAVPIARRESGIIEIEEPPPPTVTSVVESPTAHVATTRTETTTTTTSATSALEETAQLGAHVLAKEANRQQHPPQHHQQQQQQVPDDHPTSSLAITAAAPSPRSPNKPDPATTTASALEDTAQLEANQQQHPPLLPQHHQQQPVPDDHPASSLVITAVAPSARSPSKPDPATTTASTSALEDAAQLEANLLEEEANRRQHPPLLPQHQQQQQVPDDHPTSSLAETVVAPSPSAPSKPDPASFLRNFIRGSRTDGAITANSANSSSICKNDNRNELGEKTEGEAEAEGESTVLDCSLEPSHWRHFEPLKRMRLGIPYHRLSVNEKLVVLEFLLDELLNQEAFADEFQKRRYRRVLDDSSVPYGKLPSEAELADIVNADECAICLQEGELLCCDGCTCSYHRHCLNMSQDEPLPEGRWLCPECLIPDPARFGTLHGGRKSELDWFTLDDIRAAHLGSESLSSSSQENPLDRSGSEDKFLVINGFVFRRQIKRDKIETKESLFKSAMSIELLSNQNVQVVMSLVGAMAGEQRPWPFAQIPSTSESFSNRRDFDPFCYASRYKTAPLPFAASKKAYEFQNLDFETHCGATPITSKISFAVGRNTGVDKSLVTSLTSSTSLYDPYEVIRAYILNLETDLSKSYLLDEFWGMRNQTSGDLLTWSRNVAKSQSILKLAVLLVQLVDAMHPRAFSENWFKPVTSRLQGVSAVHETLQEEDETFPMHDPTPEAIRLSSLCRDWERSSISDLSKVMAKEAICVGDLIGGYSLDFSSTIHRIKKTRMKQRKRSQNQTESPTVANQVVENLQNGHVDHSESSKLNGERSHPPEAAGMHGSDDGIVLANSDPNEDTSTAPKLRRRTRGDLHFGIDSSSACVGGVQPGSIAEVKLAEQKIKRMAALVEEVKVPTAIEVFWPVAGKKLFAPAGVLPRSAIRQLARNAGTIVAPFMTYSSVYEVGQASVYHVWRKRVLCCYSYEELLLHIRMLQTFLDMSVIRKCATIAQRSQKPKARSSVIISSERDLRTGIQYYLLHESRTNSARWESSLVVDLQPLVRELSRRRKNRITVTQAAWNKRRYLEFCKKKIELEARKKIELEARKKIELETRKKIELEARKKIELEARAALEAKKFAQPTKQSSPRIKKAARPRKSKCTVPDAAPQTLKSSADDRSNMIESVNSILRQYEDEYKALLKSPNAHAENDLIALRASGLNRLRRFVDSTKIIECTNALLVVELRSAEDKVNRFMKKDDNPNSSGNMNRPQTDAVVPTPTSNMLVPRSSIGDSAQAGSSHVPKSPRSGRKRKQPSVSSTTQQVPERHPSGHAPVPQWQSAPPAGAAETVSRSIVDFHYEAPVANSFSSHLSQSRKENGTDHSRDQHSNPYVASSSFEHPSSNDAYSQYVAYASAASIPQSQHLALAYPSPYTPALDSYSPDEPPRNQTQVEQHTLSLSDQDLLRALVASGQLCAGAPGNPLWPYTILQTQPSYSTSLESAQSAPQFPDTASGSNQPVASIYGNFNPDVQVEEPASAGNYQHQTGNVQGAYGALYLYPYGYNAPATSNTYQDPSQSLNPYASLAEPRAFAYPEPVFAQDSTNASTAPGYSSHAYQTPGATQGQEESWFGGSSQYSQQDVNSSSMRAFSEPTQQFQQDPFSPLDYQQEQQQQYHQQQPTSTSSLGGGTDVNLYNNNSTTTQSSEIDFGALQNLTTEHLQMLLQNGGFTPRNHGY